MKTWEVDVLVKIACSVCSAAAIAGDVGGKISLQVDGIIRENGYSRFDIETKIELTLSDAQMVNVRNRMGGKLAYLGLIIEGEG